MKKPIITGYNGCTCHPFLSWKESEEMHKQKFEIGTPVRHRCYGRKGYIHEKLEEYFYIVKYGVIPRENCLVHSALLIEIDTIPTLPDYKTLVSEEKKWIEKHNIETRKQLDQMTCSCGIIHPLVAEFGKCGKCLERAKKLKQ